MEQTPVQDYYPDSFSHCYGCGRLNERGLQLKSYVQGEEVVARFRPQPDQLAVPGYVYGGLIASLIDCHSMATAAAAAYRTEGRALGTEPLFRFVTASLHVEFLKPTPVGVPLEIRARAKEVKGRRVTVETALLAGGEVTARGEVVAVEIPERMQAPENPI